MDISEATFDPGQLSAEVDRCVKCGLCLPECPTYGLSQNEAESPRGRIALIEALVKGQLEMSPALDRHLDSCLMCRRCEEICPSQVKFGSLMDQARQITLEYRPFWLKGLVGILSRYRLIRPALRLAKRFRLPAATNVPGPEGSFQGSYPARGRQKGHLGLFIGCVSGVLQDRALAACIRLLTGLGYRISIPPGQVCCGAMHGHMGAATKAQAFAKKNRTVFAESGVETLISAASGCGAQLQEQGLGDQLVHLDILQFLVQPGLLDRVAFRPLGQSVAVHLPCTLTNVLKADQAMISLLSLIPDLEIHPLPENTICCGSAGTFSLSHPEMAQALRQPKVDAIRDLQPDILVTANPGCALHLANGLAELAETGKAIPVLHPVELLAQQFIS